jgi:hypothetical protein
MSLDIEEQTLVRRADLARARLLAVVDQLDRKRASIRESLNELNDTLEHPMKMVTNRLPAPSLVIAVGAAGLFVAGTLGYLVIKRQRQKSKFELYR